MGISGAMAFRRSGEYIRLSENLLYLDARISEALDLDEKHGENWLEIAENLAPYPKGTISGDSGESNSLERGGCEAGGSASGRNAGQRDLL